MLDAVLDYIEERFQNNFREVCEQTEDSLERFHRLLVRQLRLIQESPAIPTVVFSQGVFSDISRRRERMHRIFGEFSKRLAWIAQLGQKQGKIRKDLSPETIVLFWVGMIQPAALLYYLSNGKYELQKHGKTSWKAFQELVKEK
jgi:hypothetical protein